MKIASDFPPNWLNSELYSNHLISTVPAAYSSEFLLRNRVPHSLGRLTSFAATLSSFPADVSKIELHVFCGSHGIERYDVSSINSRFVASQYRKGLKGRSIGGIVAASCGVAYHIWDCGIDEPTGDITQTAAMTHAQINAAMLIGWNAAMNSSAGVLAVGELGACNTTCATALSAIVLNADAEEIAGYGSGISKRQYNNKLNVVTSVITRLRDMVGTPFDLLGEAGGKEIAALTGFILGACSRGIPVVLDGFVTCVAALIAQQTLRRPLALSCPAKTGEPGQLLVCESLGLLPILDLRHQSGDGVGAVLGSTLINTIQGIARADF